MSDTEIEEVDTKEYKKLVVPKVKKNNKWFDHVKKYRAEHPDMKYKDCLTKAKETYKKF
jgi:hypothetical protein